MLIFIIKIIKARCCIVKVTNLFKIDFTFVIDQITFYCCANYFGIFWECQREVLDPTPIKNFLPFKIILCVCMGVLSTSMSLYQVFSWCPQRPSESIISPRTRFTWDCELPLGAGNWIWIPCKSSQCSHGCAISQTPGVIKNFIGSSLLSR